ncbi:hypothetical protein F511_45033 [Dorcoceras hygrometricum]|uniref:Uncharacterized protein n=1 Tax=Dorcoceras hygrometricum TaxID=472368 RepID=A0A2Z7CCB9_9LAMI|nr:hypothetical protein F511_45033 [Dorcoceras hygrometricum]
MIAIISTITVGPCCEIGLQDQQTRFLLKNHSKQFCAADTNLSCNSSFVLERLKNQSFEHRKTDLLSAEYLFYDVASLCAISSHLLNSNTTSLQRLRFASSADCDDIKADVITAHSI